MLSLHKNRTKIILFVKTRVTQVTRVTKGIEANEIKRLVTDGYKKESRVTKGYKGYKLKFVTLVTPAKKIGLQNSNPCKTRRSAAFPDM